MFGDLGKTSEKRGISVATVAGIVDGTGAVGAAIGQWIVAWLAEGQVKGATTDASEGAGGGEGANGGTEAVDTGSTTGWQHVFDFFMFATACSILCLLQLTWKDRKTFFDRRRLKRTETSERNGGIWADSG